MKIAMGTALMTGLLNGGHAYGYMDGERNAGRNRRIREIPGKESDMEDGG